MTRLHAVVPEGIDDPERPSGGNLYDRRIVDALTRIGWQVQEHPIPGEWPAADHGSRARLSDVLHSVPDDDVVLIDGLIASPSADVLGPHTERIHQVVLMHMPQGNERSVMSSASAVVATSQWTRQWLLDAYALNGDRVHVVEPGVEQAALTHGSNDGGRLLCVGAVAPHKGHDVLVESLLLLSDLHWTCSIVGSLDTDPTFAAGIARRIRDSGLADRLRMTGPLTGHELEQVFSQSDLLVHPSRQETYGMVITEALARGIPVVATDIGGIPTALGFGTHGQRPGMLVEAEDPVALAAALETWLVSEIARRGFRDAALDRRAYLSGWDTAAERLSLVLREVAA